MEYRFRLIDDLTGKEIRLSKTEVEMICYMVSNNVKYTNTNVNEDVMNDPMSLASTHD